MFLFGHFELHRLLGSETKSADRFEAAENGVHSHGRQHDSHDPADDARARGADDGLETRRKQKKTK